MSAKHFSSKLDYALAAAARIGGANSDAQKRRRVLAKPIAAPAGRVKRPGAKQSGNKQT